MRKKIFAIALLLATTFCTTHAQANFTRPKIARTPQPVQQTRGERPPPSPSPKGREIRGKKQETEVRKATPSFEQMNDYELELKASSGSADAQYALGRRWVQRGDSVSVVKGVNWLKLAAANGHRQAQSLLRSVKF